MKNQFLQHLIKEDEYTISTKEESKDDNYLRSRSYLRYLVYKAVYKGQSSFSDIVKAIESKYPLELTGLRFLEENIIKPPFSLDSALLDLTSIYYSTSLSDQYVDDADQLIIKFNSFKINNIATITTWLLGSSNSFIEENKYDLFSIFYLAASLDYQVNKYSSDYYLASYCVSKVLHSSRVDKLLNLVNNIDPTYLNLDLSVAFKHNYIVNVLKELGGSTLQDLSKINIDLLTCLLSVNYESITKLLFRYQKDYIVWVKEEISRFFNVLTDKELIILYNREAIFNNHKKQSCYSISNKFKLNKESVRFFCQSYYNKLREKVEDASKVIESILSIYDNKDTLSYTQLLNILGSSEHCAILAILLGLDDTQLYKYDANYSFFYLKDYSKVEEIVDEILSKFSIVIKLSVFETLNDFTKLVIQKNYLLRKGKMYVKRGLTVGQTYLLLIDELFPHGYHISGDDYDYLIAKYAIVYEQKDNLITYHALNGLIQRSEYVLVDRGTYINKKNAIIMPNYLVQEISSYLKEKEEVVYYLTIYQEFKEALNEIGIYNSYYLKGILDEHLDPAYFNPRKDYIILGNCETTGRNSIEHYFRSFEGAFTFEEIQAHFPGIKPYTLFSNLYLYPDLIWLSYYKFIFFDKTNIDPSLTSQLEEIVLKSFDDEKQEIISIKYVFDVLNNYHKELLAKLNYIDSHYSLFFLLRYLLGSKFFWRRPYLSKTKCKLSSRQKIINYLLSHEVFSSKTINDYCNRMSIILVYSFNSVMDELFDLYVQYDRNICVAKSSFPINKEQLNQIEENIDNLLTTFSTIDTKDFSNYSLFPLIEGYTWNKYLLAGIARTFFKDKYDTVIEYVTNNNTYHQISFKKVDEGGQSNDIE